MKPKNLQRSFIKNGKERNKCSLLLKRMEKNAKNVSFFYKEQKRTQKKFRSFIKNGKGRKKRSVLYKEWKRTQECCFLLKRTDAQPCA